ncbi:MULTISPECIES: hypothetical protein [Pectobacterium]|uniref:hypothetical protein n=1 Tax=Pectobacterium TaxID=122277 RepID=UPI000DCF9AFA|nr:MULTISPECIES: hypothetical protein [Pectobacterium]GKW43584.1 hypothetical protein PEC301879_34420 [Pectobacterium carotovorum subsp. carotovorum]
MNIFSFDYIDLRLVLSPHKFYVEQAKSRLLSQFSGLSTECDLEEERYLERTAEYFDPDRDDPAEAYENATQIGITHMHALMDMKNTVTLAINAGMYHQFDKQLRDLILREFCNWNSSKLIRDIVWRTSFERIMELMEWIGFNVTNKSYFHLIDACRLVVNVYKHGDGVGHKTLLQRYPKYYQQLLGKALTSHVNLQIEESHFDEFSTAIVTFWEDLQLHCQSELLLGIDPTWWPEKAINKDVRRKC